MVRAVHSYFVSAGDLFQARSTLDARRVKRLRRSGLAVVPLMLKGRVQLARNVLHKRPAEKHIQRLNAVANREDRLVAGERIFEGGENRHFSVRIGGGGFPVNAPGGK